MAKSKIYERIFNNKQDAQKFYSALQFSKNLGGRTCSTIAGGNGACKVTYWYNR